MLWKAAQGAAHRLEVELLQTASSNMRLDEMKRHVAPAEAGEQVVEARAEIGETPDTGADDAAGEARGHLRAIGQHQLQVRQQGLGADRTGLWWQGMVCGNDWHQRDRSQGLAFPIGACH